MNMKNIAALLILFTVSISLIAGCAVKGTNVRERPDKLKHAQKALTSGDYDTAYKLYLEAQKEEGLNGHLAQFSLGLFHKNAWGRNEDQVSACRWFGKSSEGGIPYSQHLYAECLEAGTLGEVDYKGATNWYAEAAEGGYSISNCNLGWLYMTGAGVEKNPLRALELCHSAVNSSTAAMVWMGRLLLEGDQSVRNYDQARQWFEQATQYKLPEAFFYLGVMVEKGLVKDVPLQVARKMYEEAAAMAYVAAYYPAGRLYFEGPHDTETGLISEHGLAKAYLWLSAAKSKPYSEEHFRAATDMLKEVLKVMPESWIHDLDHKVERHIEENHS